MLWVFYGSSSKFSFLRGSNTAVFHFYFLSSYTVIFISHLTIIIKHLYLSTTPPKTIIIFHSSPPSSSTLSTRHRDVDQGIQLGQRKRYHFPKMGKFKMAKAFGLAQYLTTGCWAADTTADAAHNAAPLATTALTAELAVLRQLAGKRRPNIRPATTATKSMSDV